MLKRITPRQVEKILIIITILISIGALIYFITHGALHLSHYDALARLNIARRTIDSLTPGFGQLGGIWLPFPQILYIPFIWSSAIWHTSAIGSAISMVSFVISALYLFRTIKLVTKSTLAAILGWAIYVTNVNILLLQSMAMSEVFFLLTIILSIYYLIKWAKTADILDLMYAGFFVMIGTLTRYEGYFIFIAAVVSIILIVRYFDSDRSKGKLTGTVLLFATLGGFGIVLWSIYAALIFDDPLFWLGLYSQSKGQILTVDASAISAVVPEYTRPTNSLLSSLSIYSRSTFFMNGILITLAGIVSYIWLFGSTLIRFRYKEIVKPFVPIIVGGFLLFGFLVFGYKIGLIPEIEVPRLTIETLSTKASNKLSSSNIRYGITFLPFLIIAIGWAAGRKKIIAVLMAIVLAAQLLTGVTTNAFMMFQLPVKWEYTIPEHAVWFTDNYDHGLVLISANRFENLMFQSNLSYDSFIYEGTQHYWTDSLEYPSRHARWVLFDEEMRGDAVASAMKGRLDVLSDYTLVYENKSMKIYKLKEK